MGESSNGYQKPDPSLIRQLTQWFSQTPWRSLEVAYQSALAIQTLEKQYFGGKPIPAPNGKGGKNTQDYFFNQLQKHLTTMQVRLAEYRASRPLAGATPPSETILAQLALIDTMQTRYENPRRPRATPPTAVVVAAPPAAEGVVTDPEEALDLSDLEDDELDDSEREEDPPVATRRAQRKKSALKKTSIVPRSIIDTGYKLLRQFSPRYREITIEEAEETRAQTLAVSKFLVVLILLPFLAQVLSRQLVYGPLVEHFRADIMPAISFNVELQEDAFHEIEIYRERLEFEELIGLAPERSAQERRHLLEEKAAELTLSYRQIPINGLKNILADITYFVAFAWIAYLGREEFNTLKSFLDDLIYGLSDSAKAFIIILFTDIFVGYHSPHGWEVVLTLIARHFGIPESPMLNGAFIATVPVVLDTLFKYWIFRYLNQLSPSAVATYKDMKE